MVASFSACLALLLSLSVKDMLPLSLDLLHPLHGLDRLLHHLPVVSDGHISRFSNSSVESTVISLPAALRNAFVQRSLRGFLRILKFLWHFERQKRKMVASLRTKEMPWPG